jgi:hypothetical protein
MLRKLVMGFAPVLAVTAFASVPGTAQAACVSAKGEKECPHYYVNGVRLKGGSAQTKTLVEWGTFTFKYTKGRILGAHLSCHVAAAGTVFNPEPLETSAGEGLTAAYATFVCEQELMCPTGTTVVRVTAEKLPWHDLLTEEVAGTIRQETTGVTLKLECFSGETLIGAELFVVGEREKGLRPKIVEGPSATHPSLREYDAASGEVELEGSLGAVQGKFEGALKFIGYNAQETVAARNP